ncbi:hypothetical protein BJ875DRAFT_459039 [Amylocarpus encephaloides]|uniref:Uncharacterized protein n=1 Tax=Amylocarpus encephaloides TaxID=45428 RepID=A0A9P8C7W0_9HELO|nr:hypothetical protein BJ875DRAFT_459039 [Amylocarpus encephaloides]
MSKLSSRCWCIGLAINTAIANLDSESCKVFLYAEISRYITTRKIWLHFLPCIQSTSNISSSRSWQARTRNEKRLRVTRRQCHTENTVGRNTGKPGGFSLNSKDRNNLDVSRS